MKKFLLIAFLIIPFLGMSQTKPPIDGFLGIKFGGTREAVTAALKAKGASLTKQGTGTTSLIFSNVKLGSRQAIAFFVYFVDNKACSALFVFQANKEAETMDYYYSLVNEINEKYGRGDSTKDFKSPFTFGDGNELTALSQGYAKMYTDWQSGKGSIEAAIDNKADDLTVSLSYQNDDLKAAFDAKKSAKEKADF